MNNTKWIY